MYGARSGSAWWRKFHHIVTPRQRRRADGRPTRARTPDLFCSVLGPARRGHLRRRTQDPPSPSPTSHLPPNTNCRQTALAWIQLLAEESLSWSPTHVGGTFVTHFNPLPALTRPGGGSRTGGGGRGRRTTGGCWRSRGGRYDPRGLLKCWKCVGFEDEDVESERFKCQGKLQRDVERAFV
ncbi:hypothetical protein F5X96DRAFT_642180 [Biscogniauxia mediterranea]|nr:hypothetical protein F5X96DRAFT_642180 [Biscogniauxia mediterranea]